MHATLNWGMLPVISEHRYTCADVYSNAWFHSQVLEVNKLWIASKYWSHFKKKYIAFESVPICNYSNMSPKVNIKAWTAIGQVKMWMRLLVRSPTSHEIIQSQRVRLVIHNAIYRESTDRHEQVSRADVYWPQSKFWLY